MNLILLGLDIFLILINLVGLALLLVRYLPGYALAKAAGVLAVTLAMFFIEHFHGLGSLTWLWPLLTGLSALVVLRNQDLLVQHWKSEGVFVLAFLYAFLWRAAFPDIYPTSEHVTDLYFISNYLGGETLPPPDRWYPPFRFDCYYAFQHYAAGLMARIFGLDGGLAYNLAFCVLMALSISLVWQVIASFCASTRARALLIVAFVLGGTGVSPIIHLLIDEQKSGRETDLWASQRFAGNYDVLLNTDLADTLHLKPRKDNLPYPNFQAREVPVESFSYQFFIGDYHPPLGSFFLLLFALALVVALEGDRRNRVYQALLALTVPAVVATNTWLLPYQALLVLSWAGYRQYVLRDPPDWRALIGGGVCGFLLIFPFLTDFGAQAQATPIRWVEPQDHTPLAQFIAQHWPVLLLSLFGLVQFRQRPIAAYLGFLVAATLLIAEFFYVDDVTADKFVRTNTTMKWWSWSWAAATGALAAATLASSQRLLRYGTVITLLLLTTYSFDLVRYWIGAPKSAALRLSGHNWLSADATNKDMINFLKASPDGIVLESIENTAYTPSTTFALFSGKSALLGWPQHLGVWRGASYQINMQQQNVKDFYEGKKADAVAWLRQNQVRYVVWKSENNKPQTKILENIQSQIADGYFWKPFYQAGDYQVGLFVRK